MRRSSSSFIDCSSIGHGRDGAQAPALGAEALHQARGEAEALEIGSEALLDAGPQNLHGDSAAVWCHRLVHLRHRGGGNRCAEVR